MADVQAFRYILHRRLRGDGMALYCEQKLVMLWIQAGSPRRAFTEMNETADLVPKFGERAVVSERQIPSHDFRSYPITICFYQEEPQKAAEKKIQAGKKNTRLTPELIRPGPTSKFL